MAVESHFAIAIFQVIFFFHNFPQSPKKVVVVLNSPARLERSNIFLKEVRDLPKNALIHKGAKCGCGEPFWHSYISEDNFF